MLVVGCHSPLLHPKMPVSCLRVYLGAVLVPECSGLGLRLGPEPIPTGTRILSWSITMVSQMRIFVRLRVLSQRYSRIDRNAFTGGVNLFPLPRVSQFRWRVVATCERYCKRSDPVSPGLE